MTNRLNVTVSLPHIEWMTMVDERMVSDNRVFVINTIAGQIDAAMQDLASRCKQLLKEAFDPPKPVFTKGYVRPNFSTAQWKERYGDPEELEEPDSEATTQVWMPRKRHQA